MSYSEFFLRALFAASQRQSFRSPGGRTGKTGPNQTWRGGSQLSRHTHSPAGTKLAKRFAEANRGAKPPRGW